MTLRVLSSILVVVSLVSVLRKPWIERIVVSKSSRVLTAYGAGGRVVKQVPIALGSNDQGPKLREGDRRTPEGQYYVCFRNPQSRFRRSLALSYPNLEDARRGMEEGLIGEEEYRRIAEAQQRRQIPPWKTALGGEIFIHGGRGTYEATAGCIGISDDAVEELFPLVALGTPILIEP
jgi:murein L,D-transpeptidase YafK